jgi:hypothetical protein
MGYYDRVSVDTCNKVFYVYKLGRYNNRMLYTFGETYDIHATEFRLRSIVPIYEKCFIQPVEEDMKAYERFVDKVRHKVVPFPLDESIEVFHTENGNWTANDDFRKEEK